MSRGVGRKPSVTEAKRRKHFKEIVSTVVNAAGGSRKTRAEKLSVYLTSKKRVVMSRSAV